MNTKPALGFCANPYRKGKIWNALFMRKEHFIEGKVEMINTTNKSKNWQRLQSRWRRQGTSRDAPLLVHFFLNIVQNAVYPPPLYCEHWVDNLRPLRGPSHIHFWWSCPLFWLGRKCSTPNHPQILSSSVGRCWCRQEEATTDGWSPQKKEHSDKSLVHCSGFFPLKDDLELELYGLVFFFDCNNLE